jgi:DNA-binding response OmpR family regulator
MSFSLPASSSMHQILGHTIVHSADKHTITIDGRFVNFSRTEYELMILLLQHVEQSKPFILFADLKQCFRQPPDNLRRLLSRRMNCMRERLWPFELDIVSVRDQGYTLIHKPA